MSGEKKTIKGFKQLFKPLEILTEEQVNTIHKSTLRVLEKTGVTFLSDKALKLFKKNGCSVDFESKRVRFPSSLVEECIRKTPSSFTCRARSPKNDLIIGSNILIFTEFAGMETVNLDTWEKKCPTRKEFYDYIKVLDALSNVHMIWAYPYYTFEGIPGVMGVPECTAAKFRNSSKLQLIANNEDADIFGIEMAKSIGVDVASVLCMAPPLTCYKNQIDAAFRCVENDFPILIVSGGIYGATAPVTIAGATITNNAELLAGVVLVNLIKPGARIMAMDFTFPMNMITGSPSFGDIGVSLHLAAFNQIWRKYGIPRCSASVGNSKKPDFQNSYEKTISGLIAALSGINVLNFHGGIYGEITAHPVQAVLDDDIAGMIGRFMNGIDINDDTLALDLIDSVGPIPGVFIDKDHTFKYWKKEQFLPKVADRLTYFGWQNSGKKFCLDYAKERVEEILAKHKTEPLKPKQEEEIEKILEEALKYYKKKGKI